jgi:hypothetical protein
MYMHARLSNASLTIADTNHANPQPSIGDGLGIDGVVTSQLLFYSSQLLVGDLTHGADKSKGVCVFIATQTVVHATMVHVSYDLKFS